MTFHLPNSDGSALNLLYQNGQVESVEYAGEEILVTAVVDAKLHGQLKRYDPIYPTPAED